MRRFKIEVDGKVYDVKVKEMADDATVDRGMVEAPRADAQKEAAPRAKAEGGGIVAPMMGTIIDVLVRPGDEVEEGKVVAKLEAMKMEMNVVSDLKGTVKEVYVKKGENVQSGDQIISFE